jgi:hypothetical protein
MSTSTPPTGPHLIAALLCERVLQEQDGVVSIIRIIDRLTQTAAGAEAPDQMTPFVHPMTMFVALKSDQARGRMGIRVRPEAPGGFQLPAIEQAITLGGTSAGVNLIMPMVLPIDREGIYWFDVFLTGPAPQEDRLLTRIPLEIIYQPQRILGSGQG